MSNGKQTALVISGGGAKGAFAVGIVKYLFQEYRKDGWFTITGGTSTGALIAPIAAIMAAPGDLGKQALKKLVNVYSNTTTEKVLEKQSIFELIRRQDCLNETDPLMELIDEHLDQEWFDWLQTEDAPYCYVVYTNFQTGQAVAVSPKDRGMTRERFMQAMLASSSVPVIMEAAIIDGAVCYDGGIRDLLPMSHAIEHGAETIVPIFLSPEKYASTTSSFERIDRIMLKTLDVLVDEAGKNDFEMALLINVAIQAREQMRTVLKGDQEALDKVNAVFNGPDYEDLFGDHLRVLNIVKGLRPDTHLTEDSLSFNPHEMRLWIRFGQDKAEEVFEASPFV
jgi:predicted patatin/cPLA2 family phospholipase